MARTPKTMNNSKTKKPKRIGLIKNEDGSQSYLSPKAASSRGSKIVPENLSRGKQMDLARTIGSNKADKFVKGAQSRTNASVHLAPKLKKKPVGGK